MSTISTIKLLIKGDDGALNAAIQGYIAGPQYFGEPGTPKDQVTVSSWRISHYAELRRMDYPDMTEYIDAQVKLSSSDPAVQAAGQAQLNKYNADCLAVKSRFPKE